MFPDQGDAAFDYVRLKYLAAYAEHVGRDVVLYASAWTQGPIEDHNLWSIRDEDMQALMEVIHGLRGPNLDLIIHSPGGSPEVTESIVHYLRLKFRHIRAVIPQAAMSAASMLACSCDEIVMGKHSCLGPTDLQVPILTRNGYTYVPAQAVIDEFTRAREECADPNDYGALNVWRPILEQYPPTLVQQCYDFQQLSRDLVSEWLASWMFANRDDREELARDIAGKLVSHGDHKSHNRRIPRETLVDYGVKVISLEADQVMQDLLLSVFHATTLTFANQPVAKIVENHQGRVYTCFSSQLQAQASAPSNTAEPDYVEADDAT